MTAVRADGRDARSLARSAEREQLRRVVHDYDNILAVIAGSIELARRKLARGDAQDAERQLERAVSAIRKGAELSSRLISFSRGCDEAPHAHPGEMTAMGRAVDP